ncbi:MAG: hypothetical protein ACREPB_05850 [Arenimonas sp.]
MLNSATMFALILLALISINITAIYKSRKGRTRMHSLAFMSGAAGLCGLPLTIIAALPLALQFLTPANGSPEAMMFYSISLITLFASLSSAITSILLQIQHQEIQTLQ